MARDWGRNTHDRDEISRGGIQEVTQAGERSEWAKSRDMATAMWGTLRAEGLKPQKAAGRACRLSLRCHLTWRIAKPVANFPGIYMIIAYQEAGGWGRSEGVPIDERIEAFSYWVGRLVPFAMSMTDTRRMKALQLAPHQGQVTRSSQITAEAGGGSKTDVLQESWLRFSGKTPQIGRGRSCR